jgi:tetratricopeptide (TPR) repeat protein
LAIVRVMTGILITAYHAATASAGLYGPLDASPFDSTPTGVEELSFAEDTTGRFPLEFARVGNIGDPSRVTPERTAALALVAKMPSDHDPVRDAALASVLIRLRQTDQALDLLRRYVRDRRPTFAVFANLAHAHAVRGEWREAITAHQTALDDCRFPIAIKHGEWLKRLENQYYRKWLIIREREARDKLPVSEQLPLPLFDGPPPADAIAIVQQLLLWDHSDVRLQWLLADLYRQAHRPRAALKIYESLLAVNYSPRRLRDDRESTKALVATLPPISEPVLAPMTADDPRPVLEKLGLSIPQIIAAATIFFATTAVLLTYQYRQWRRRRLR